MQTRNPGTFLSTVVRPLVDTFGGDLSFDRSGDTVCWGYGGQSAVVALSDAGDLRAIFVDAPSTDVVSGRPAAGAYRTQRAYTLSEAGAQRMVADLIDFFSGVREPAFTFVDAYAR